MLREMSYIRDMITQNPMFDPLLELGHRLRSERACLVLTRATVARTAGVGCQKLLEVEQGRPSVATVMPR
jgi:DNA-binding XRE family transcriptional regulator